MLCFCFVRKGDKVWDPWGWGEIFQQIPVFQMPRNFTEFIFSMCLTKASHYGWPLLCNLSSPLFSFIYTQMFYASLLLTQMFSIFSPPPSYKIYNNGLITLTSTFSTPTLRVLCELNEEASWSENPQWTDNWLQLGYTRCKTGFVFECDGCGLSFPCDQIRGFAGGSDYRVLLFLSQMCSQTQVVPIN